MKDDRFHRLKKNISDYFLSKKYVSRAINAFVLILVLIVVLKKNPPGPIESIIIISWTMLCLNTLRVFSQISGQVIEERRLLKHHEGFSYFKELNFIVVELIPVIIIFIISWFGIININTAYLLAQIILTSLLFIYGFLTLKILGKRTIICILGGIFFTLIALSLVFMRTLIK